MTAETSQQPARKHSRRATRIGVVTSTARAKTVRVTFTFMVRQAKYGKYIRRNVTLHAHDERGECHDGDIVEVMESRPISKTKHWRLVRIVRAAPQQKAGD